MGQQVHSPLSGHVKSGFGGSRHKRKVIAGITAIGLVPFLLSTYAASVTVGVGSLEFGQGSQQAIACDSNVYIALGQEWLSQPTDVDSSAGYFRVRTLTVADLDLMACRGKKLRVRLIDTQGSEIQIGALQEMRALQISLPDVDQPVSVGDSVELALTYLASDGTPITGQMDASVSLNVSGTSIYDGVDLSANSADVTFYIDPTASIVNIDGQFVGRATVETVNNPTPRETTP